MMRRLISGRCCSDSGHAYPVDTQGFDMKPFNEEINAARIGLMLAVQEVKRFTDSYSDQQIVKLLVAVLKTPGSLQEPGNDHELWDAVRRKL